MPSPANKTGEKTRPPGREVIVRLGGPHLV